MLAMLAMAFTLVFTGCKKDDEPTPITKEKLTAVWKLESMKGSITAAGTTTPFNEPGTGETLELKADGTAIEKDADGTATTGTWTLAGTKVTFKSISYEGTFDVKDASSVLVLYQVEEVDFFGVKMKTETTVNFKK
jgi:hypothetical protein